MKREQTHKFSMIPKANIPRSVFDRSHSHKTTFDAGNLIPVFVDEVLPGDTINLSMSAFARLATPLVPTMDNLWLDCFFFAVPNRLLWAHWQNFMGEQDNPDDSTDYLVPIINSGESGFAAESIYDYMGIPTDVPDLDVSALPLRAYNLIYHDWFRDQNLQDSARPVTTDGPDNADTYSIKRRGKRHDYFTSALPWPQKGAEVQLPIGTEAPVIGDGAPAFYNGTDIRNLYEATASNHVTFGVQGTVGSGYDQALVWNNTALYADLSTATAYTINSLREAFQLQKLLERDARGGTRYTEILRAHFGVVSPDARLQRPEYLGGGTIPVNMHPVPQTSQSTVQSPQGHLAGYGTAGGTVPGFTKSFVEHCVVIGLVSVRADLSYQQGLHRMWSRRTKHEFYWPALAHLGEQAVYNRELYAQGESVINPESTVPYDGEPFGYQERWAEYRYAPSKVTAQFRSNFAQSLDTWHYAQDFDALPSLNHDFIIDNPPIDRTIAVDSFPHFIMDTYFKVRHARPMPTYSVPGLVDHF